MSETAEEMEERLLAMTGGTRGWDLSWRDRDAIHYALRAIEERRELLAALREMYRACNVAPEGRCHGACAAAMALVAKCEAP
jgi:hypothetical protein